MGKTVLLSGGTRQGTHVHKSLCCAMPVIRPPELSELVQHEVDHLDGILAVDRIEHDAHKVPATRNHRGYNSGPVARHACILSWCCRVTGLSAVFVPGHGRRGGLCEQLSLPALFAFSIRVTDTAGFGILNFIPLITAMQQIEHWKNADNRYFSWC